MEEKFIIGILTAIIGTLFTLVIRLVSKINKDKNDTTSKLNREVHDLSVTTQLILERVTNNIDNVNEMKESLIKFREDLSSLQLDNRELIRFKSDIENRIINLEKSINK